jgi:hypothetical protein
MVEVPGYFFNKIHNTFIIACGGSNLKTALYRLNHDEYNTKIASLYR